MGTRAALRILTGLTAGVAFTLTAGALTSGCGDTNVNVTQPPNPNQPGVVPNVPTPAPTIININVTELFTPTPIIVQQHIVTKIATVVIVNNKTESHSVVADDGRFNSGIIPPGEKVEFEVDEPGDYPYHCGVHPEERGILRVQPAPEPSPSPVVTPTDTPTEPPVEPTPIEPSPSPLPIS